MSNPWLEFSETVALTRKPRTQPRVVQNDRQAPMVLRGAEKEVAEGNALFRRYRRYKAFEYKQALAGPHGEALRELHTTLKGLTLDSGGDPLLMLMQRYRWLLGYDRELRHLVLHLIDDAICRLRVQNGLPIIDDSLPFLDEEPTVFEICRSNLTQGDPP